MAAAVGQMAAAVGQMVGIGEMAAIGERQCVRGDAPTAEVEESI